MQPTTIQWTHFTNNPFRARAAGSDLTKGGYASGVGHFCLKVSPGCKNCYSSDLQPRFGLPQFQDQRRGGVESFLDAFKLDAVLRRKKPTKIFWCDMTDMFGEWVPNEWIAACFGVMAATPQHIHQVLTKRAERLPEWFEWLGREQNGAYPLTVQELERHLKRVAGIDAKAASIEWPLSNVHLGVSVEDQQRADERVPLLLSAPAAVRWVSAEPLLGPVDLSEFLSPLDCELDDADGKSLDWIVVGGESGDRARPFDLAWARSILGQCQAARIPAFMKQMGSCCVQHTFAIDFKDSHGGDPSEWREEFRVREFPE